MRGVQAGWIIHKVNGEIQENDDDMRSTIRSHLTDLFISHISNQCSEYFFLSTIINYSSWGISSKMLTDIELVTIVNEAFLYLFNRKLIRPVDRIVSPILL